jgi:hypothetical protein
LIRHSINYLIEAGRPRSLERAIVLAQVLLESVSYAWLVQETRRQTPAQFRRSTAAQTIREMLSVMGIPTELPGNLGALTAAPAVGGHIDGPRAFTWTRNRLVHFEVDRPGIDPNVLLDAWRLGSWYCELTILRMLEFNGRYRSRLSDQRWSGNVENVPWH